MASELVHLNAARKQFGDKASDALFGRWIAGRVTERKWQPLWPVGHEQRTCISDRKVGEAC